MGGVISAIPSAIGGAANWVGNEAGQAAHAVGDAAHWLFTSPQYGRTPAEAAQYQQDNAATIAAANAADAAKQKAYYGTGNPTLDGVINAVGGVGYSSEYGLHQGAADPITMNTVTGIQNRPNNSPAPDPTQAIANQVAQQPSPSVHMFSFGQIDPGTGLQYSGDNTGWVTQTQFAQMNNMPAPTTPQSVAQQQIDAGNARPGDHRTNPQTGVPQTFGIDGVWRDGNSASPPNAVSLPTNPAPGGGGAIPTQGVNTNTTNPMASADNWQQQYDKIQNDYQHNLNITPAQRDAQIAALGPKPGTPGTPGSGTPPLVTPQAGNPAPAVANPSGSGAPGVSTAPTGQPNPNLPAAAGAAAGAGGVGDAVSWIIKNLGLDANTAAILAAGGASSVASWMAANEQSNGATNAANTQSDAYKNALTQLGNQIHDTNTVNTNNYTDQQVHLQPYLTSGTNALNDYNTAVSGYDPNKALSGDPSTWQDPGYHFRLDEGINALQNSAAAKGGLLSGNTLRGITDYAQNSASQEYKNAYDRYNTTFGTKMNALQPLLSSGQQAVSQYIGAGNNYASNTQQAAQQNQSQYANLTTGQGNALAQGILGASNAKASGYAAGNTIAQGMLSQYSQLQMGNAANNLTKALNQLGTK